MLNDVRAWFMVQKIKYRLRRLKRKPELYAKVSQELTHSFLCAQTGHEKKAYSRLLEYWMG